MLSKREIVNVMREKLIPRLLKNCLSQDKAIFTLSFSIVSSLIKNYRESYKVETGIFFEHVFLKLLESSNSNYNQRIFTIHVFEKIFKSPRTLFELYVNYDCSLEQRNFVEQIIGLLVKIC